MDVYSLDDIGEPPLLSNAVEGSQLTGLLRLWFLIACSMQKLSQKFSHTASDQKPEPGKAWERG